ncbi:MAG: hypothetical protein ACRCYQ_15720 [Nocardioides sp.]
MNRRQADRTTVLAGIGALSLAGLVGLSQYGMVGAVNAATVPAHLAAPITMAANHVENGPSSGTGRGRIGDTGTGSFTASGKGVARFKGSIESSTWSGTGTLRIVDRGGDAQIVADGNGRKRERGNRTWFAGFKGALTISGSDVRIVLAGKKLDVDIAQGSGRYRAIGKGTYTDDGVSGEFAAE